MAAIRVLCEVRNGYVHVQLVHDPLKISTGNFDNPSVQSFICNSPGGILLHHSFTEYSRQDLQFLIECLIHVIGEVPR
jgi:hypothetical protein